MADASEGGGGEKPCCSALNERKNEIATTKNQRANHYGVKSIVPPHAPKLNVMVVDVEDLGKIVDEKGVCSLCRCWASSKHPFCDGSHNAHNEKTGDNSGPLVILAEGKTVVC